MKKIFFSILFAVLAVTGSARATTISLDPADSSAANFMASIGGTIGFTSYGNAMTGSFATANVTLDEAAALGGYAYFNWFQVVKKYPGNICVYPFVIAPFVDPIVGGCSFPSTDGQQADNNPWYWDVGEGQFTPGLTLADNVDSNHLTFYDAPYAPAAYFGFEMEFYTVLVGVKEDGLGVVLSDALRWTSNNTQVEECFCYPVRNIEQFVGSGGITGSAAAPLDELPQAVLTAMHDVGISNSPLPTVPVPASGILLLSAIAGIGLFQTKRRSARIHRSTLLENLSTRLTENHNPLT